MIQQGLVYRALASSDIRPWSAPRRRVNPDFSLRMRDVSVTYATQTAETSCRAPRRRSRPRWCLLRRMSRGSLAGVLLVPLSRLSSGTGRGRGHG